MYLSESGIICKDSGSLYLSGYNRSVRIPLICAIEILLCGKDCAIAIATWWLLQQNLLVRDNHLYKKTLLLPLKLWEILQHNPEDLASQPCWRKHQRWLDSFGNLLANH